MKKNPKKRFERKKVTASMLPEEETCTWSFQCQGVTSPFCYSWNNAVSCRWPFLSCMQEGVDMCGLTMLPTALPYQRQENSVCRMAGREEFANFFPSTSQVSRALSFADSKWLLDWAFGEFVLPIPNFRVEAASVLLRESVLSSYVCFQEEAAIFQNSRGDVSGSFEFRLPEDDSLNF